MSADVNRPASYFFFPVVGMLEIQVENYRMASAVSETRYRNDPDQS